MSETVIREVAKNVWTFSQPFSRYGVPVGGRSTAIRLQNGGLWVMASTPLNSETKTKLDELGPVQYIIGADAVHHMFLTEFKKAYPSAQLIAPKMAAEKYSNDKDLKFDGVWGVDPADRRYGFEEDIKACYFSGFKNKDVAFFHALSKTMIEADLLFNLPATEQYSKSKTSAKIPIFGGFSPLGWFHSRFAWSMGEDTAQMKKDVKTVASWDFERIIPCHGDVIETDGKKAWKEAYKFYID